MIQSLKKTVRTAGRCRHQRLQASDWGQLTPPNIGVRGLFDGISGTWMRQMSYSVCRFWAYDESKKLLGAGLRYLISVACFACSSTLSVQAVPLPHGSWLWLVVWVCIITATVDFFEDLTFVCSSAGGISGFIGNPGGLCLIVCNVVDKPTDAFICRDYHGLLSTSRPMFPSTYSTCRFACKPIWPSQWTNG